jgi:hypothetical protein
MNLREIYRIMVVVPEEYAQQLTVSINDIFPIRNSNYDSVAWISKTFGTETFKPLKGASPTHGTIGSISEVLSVKLEFSIPRDNNLLTSIIDIGIIPNHPWERPVIVVSEDLEFDGN